MSKAVARTNNQMSSRARTQEKNISDLLCQSLAVSLSKVEKQCGNETAKEILDILRDDGFDISSFRKQISSIQECQNITNALIAVTAVEPNK